MSDPETLIASVVAFAGGEIVGRVRLQKEVYLLDQLGLKSGFSYSYHHYGPYSADLVDAVDGAKAFRLVDEQMRHRKSDGVPFSVYCRGPSLDALLSELGGISSQEVERLLGIMQSRSATVLELAATIHWLRSKEGFNDWRPELVRRKGVKTDGGRVEEALTLLRALGLHSEH
ncbi:MAG: hypothetical protein Q8L23_12865 [Caulobacter sp.]|nr:hypothetical protein [Caulobacter sp.]